MSGISNDVEKYMQRATSAGERDKRSKDLAIVAVTLQKFMHVIFDSIESIGVVNVEFLSKSELFLRAITAQYPDDKFADILNTLKSIDPEMEKTIFYYGLRVLRSITTGKIGESDLTLFDESGEFFNAFKKEQVSEISFFVAFLVEEIIMYIATIRKTHAAKYSNVQAYREQIDRKFDELIMSAVAMLASANLQ